MMQTKNKKTISGDYLFNMQTKNPYYVDRESNWHLHLNWSGKQIVTNTDNL